MEEEEEKVEQNLRTLRFKAYYWSHEEDDEKIYIHISGITEDQKSVYVKVHGFPPFVYVELPRSIGWNKEKCKRLFEYIQATMKSKAPLFFSPLKKYILYGKKEVLTMMLAFPSVSATKFFANFCRRSLIIPGVGSFEQNAFKVHEHNIDPVIKFSASKTMKLAGWLEAKEKIIEGEEDLSVEDRKFSTADIDMNVDWKDIIQLPSGTIPSSVIVRPSYIFFDCECYSKNHNSKIPDPEIPENAIIQISIIYGRMNDPSRERILLTLGDPKEIKNVEIFSFKKEEELLLKFTELVQHYNPDIMGGYNIMKFDWGYMMTRAELLGVYPQFAMLGRLIGVKAIPVNKKWSSSAYGEQTFRYLDLQGRTNVDVLVEVERNYKLPSYSLNVVADFFLKSSKEDLSPKQLFILYQFQDEIGKILSSKVLNKDELLKLRKSVVQMMPLRKISGVVKKIRDEFLDVRTQKEMANVIRDAMYYIGVYCDKDSLLTIDICEKLNLWTTMEEMSNCTNVPMSYLHTRGQQIKVLSQIYRDTLLNDFIIPFRAKTTELNKEEKYQGATVIDAKPGDHKNVVTLDFASLYPSIMMTFNICYTTLLADDDPTPDEECNICEWSDHVGCVHDEQQRKKKKEDIMCRHNRYRFRKVRFGQGGSMEGEGLMPRLVRNLLTERKTVKKEMVKLEAKIKMHKGLATEKDIEEFKERKFDIIKKGALSEKEASVVEVCITVLNAQQLALKVSANSAYGALGAQNGFIPLIPGAASVTAMGRKLIMAAINYILRRFKNESASLVYGDTDSCMIVFKNQTLQKSFELGEKASKETSHYLKCNILGVEEDVTLTVGEDEIPIRKVKKEQLENVEEDEKILWYQYNNIPLSLEFENLYGRFLLLSKKRYVSYIMNRAGKVEKVVKKGVVLARRDNCKFLRDTYKEMVTAILDEKSEVDVMNILYSRVQALFTRQIPDTDLTIYIGVKDIKEYAKKKSAKKPFSEQNPFLDVNGEPFADPIGPLDPRFVYSNIPQVLLSLKMLRRGDVIPPNTRLEIIYLEKEDAEHQGDKAEDYTYYWENKADGLHPDYFHYLEKQLAKPISELIGVKFKHDEVKYQAPEDEFASRVEELEELQKNRIRSSRNFLKVINCPGMWDQKEERYIQCISGCTACKNEGSRSYKSKGKEAQVDYVLRCAKENKKGPNEINKKNTPKLIKAAQRYKALLVMEKFRQYFGTKKKPMKKPKAGSDTIERDGQIMKDILFYRSTYRAIVKHLKELFE